jgi:phosphoribosylaminoimidazolecarboxamide formyltransferase/IMP cyclohydrolase
LTEALAKVISEIFSEVIIAPDFEPEARSVLQKKKNLRLIRLVTSATDARPAVDVRSVCGGVLVQDADVSEEITSGGGRIVTKRRPTKTELRAMLFAWRVVKHVKSNAIVYAKADRTLSIGGTDVANRCFAHCDLESEGGRAVTKRQRGASDAFFLSRTD